MDTKTAVDCQTLLSQVRNLGDLSPVEQKVLRALTRGEWAVCGSTDDDKDPNNDPSKADQSWGSERTVRAKFIRWLCVNPVAKECVDPMGVIIYGAKIIGTLNLSFVNTFPLFFYRCSFAEDAIFRSARVPFLSFQGSWVREITADGIDIEGEAYLNDGFHAKGTVFFINAKIGGNLVCDGGSFANGLAADAIEIKGDASLRRGFRAAGEVRLLGAQVAGNLDCDCSSFTNLSRYSLKADGISVKGSVLVRQSVNEGEMRLLNADIGGNLECDGSSFKNRAGPALSADGMSVRGSVFLRHGFHSEGEVRLTGTANWRAAGL